MLIKTMTKNVSDSMAGTQDDARVLSLAETVGNMGHWYWHIQSGVMSWYDQVFCIFGRDPDTHEPTFDSFMGAVYGADRERIQGYFDQALVDGSRAFPIYSDA